MESKIAILIGFFYIFFNYDNNYDSERKYLPGIIIDLYQCYKLINKAKYDKIIVITDIEENINPSELFKIPSIKIEPKLLHFISDLKKRNQLHVYHCKQIFIDLLLNSFKEYNRVFLYYTGHYRSNYFVLPYDQYDHTKQITYINGNIPISVQYQKQNSKLLIDDFIKILKIGPKYSEIVLILDTCNGVDLGLPFIFQNNLYRLTKGPNFISNKIILITSSWFDQNSLATDSGSIFSQFLFQLIKQKTYSIKYILELFEENKRPRITASFPNLYLIPEWVFNEFFMEILIDLERNLIIINR